MTTPNPTTRPTPPHRPIRVLVLGAGYAGALAANRLRRDPRVEVTVVNPQPFFVQRIRLHQWVARTADPQVGFDHVLASDIRVVVDTATRIDAARRRVDMASGAALDYDHLIYAVGTGAATPMIPGAAEHGFGVADWVAAQQLRDHLETLDRHEPVTVIGGGLTGVELAAELAERGFGVRLVGGGAVAGSVGPRARRALLVQLGRLGVEVLESGRVVDVTSTTVTVADGGQRRELPSATTVLTTGFEAPPLAEDSGLTTDELGRLCADVTLTSVDDPRIVGAGDAVSIDGMTLRMSCQAAQPLGAQAADAVLAHLDGVAAAEVDQAFVAQCTSVGRRAATLQFTRRDDSPARMVVTGRLAALAKETVCRGTVWNIHRESKTPGAFRWLRGGTRPSAGRPSSASATVVR
ncbi:NAD(P)/FAD-dependent oxidoreductase [Gordonia sp. NPDC058843]|uniref:NAD(P)/FAD-dependent oxidoreductase n=1 Tax=Gordonia sp. NPDC058843 TaxID=3346648 RepID=UPI0036CCBDDE